MYRQNNNRIITKYSEFLKEQLALDPSPPVPAEKHVTNTIVSFDHGESDSGRDSTPVHTATGSTVTVTSAEIHNIDSEAESSENPSTSLTPLPAAYFTSSKFSDLFFSSESHALRQRDLLVQSQEGSFLRDALVSKGDTAPVPVPVVPDDTIDTVQAVETDVNDLNGKVDIDQRFETGSLAPHYAASITSSSLAETEATLRRELLNNIRAISKATFFEDIYTNRGKGHRGDLDPISSDSNNNPSSHERELEALLRSEATSPQLAVVAERDVDGMLVFETQPLNQSSPVKLDPEKESEIHQWILNSRRESETEDRAGVPEVVYKPPNIEAETAEAEKQTSVHGSPVNSFVDAESVVDLHVVASASNTPEHQTNPLLPPTSDAVQVLPTLPNIFERGSNRSVEFASDSDQSISLPNIEKRGSKQGVETVCNSDRSSAFAPVFRKVYVDNTEPVRNRRPRPSHLLKPLLIPLKPLNFSVLNPLKKQVRYPTDLPKRLSPVYPSAESEKRTRRCILGKVPGVLLRQNMDQWVAKIVRFYANGDEHLPRFEYRFRPGRDVHNFDALCDTLSEKFHLPQGVRFIFSLHGDQIQSLDDLRHEHAYVVSSTRKFKALNYGGEVVETGKPDDGGGGGSKRRSRSRSRPPSAPSNRNPPIIRVRREPSLNGVVWGSPQQEWSSSSERNGRFVQQSAVEAEKVLRAAIAESQAQAQAPAMMVNKQIIRVINGGDPTVQSQVLLNTRVSQEFQELVKDLGLAVKIPRGAPSRMETLTGRAIQSYSQLRSQLKAGNEAYYIYNLNVTSGSTTRPVTRTYLGDDQDLRHSPFGSMTKAVSNPTLPVVETSLGKKFPNSVIHLGGSQRSNPNKLSVPLGASSVKAHSSSNLTKSKVTPNTLTNSSSHPNLNQRRKSVKQRYEASKYLAHRSRSPSPN